MKNVLGLDLGVGSIGWCLLEKDDLNVPLHIIRHGVRDVPMSSDENKGYTAGKGYSKNAERTTKRSARRNKHRYQLRRQKLFDCLQRLGMMPSKEQMLELSPLELWQMRADAATEGVKLDLPILGRVLIHVLQKRGYKHSRLSHKETEEEKKEKKDKDYVVEVNSRYSQLKQEACTIGQHFARLLKANEQCSIKGKKYYNYRIKKQVFPRRAYEEELRTILNVQSNFYPDVLTDATKDEIFNVIFFQRDLKSCKNLVSYCEFESKRVTRDGKEFTIGPKVAPRTSPLAQLSMVLEAANNISLSRRGEDLSITLEKRREIVGFLNTHKVMKLKDLQTILGIGKGEGWWAGEAISKGIKGNQTRCQLVEALKGLPKEQVDSLLAFELQTEEFVDTETGEVVMRIDNVAAERQPLYRLWHLIYSIKDIDELTKSLHKLGILDETVIQRLCALDFRTPGYSNKSAKAISRIIPYLQQGLMYSEACQKAGIDHTRRMNPDRELLQQLPQIKKNELRQPVVEKILQQMINIVNALLLDPSVGQIDEIRVELARELRQNKEKRKQSFDQNKKNEERNKKLEDRIKEYGLAVTKTRIQKMKMWEESNYSCMYCGQPISVKEFLKDSSKEREHIIPRGLLFDNSFTNQVCSCHECNQRKGMRTAYDFILEDKGQNALENYIQHVNDLYEMKKISRSKLNRLLVSYNGYLDRKKNGQETKEDKALWENFIERQLRLSQYISRKAVEILQQVCRNVYVTTGSITDSLRHLWGYDEILHDLNFARYQSAGLTTMVERQKGGKTIYVERIKDWNKRMDIRHHAVDALVIACTTQGIIQRLNTYHANREETHSELKNMKVSLKDKSKSMLEVWLLNQPHIPYGEAKKAISEIAISMRPNTRLTTPGKRYVYKQGHRILAQEGIIVPRVQLHARFLYGQITPPAQANEHAENQYSFVRKYELGVGAKGFLFTGKETYKEEKSINKQSGNVTIKISDGIQNVLQSIVDGEIRQRILNRLNRGFEDGKDYRNDVKRALENIKNLEIDPIYSDDACTRPIRSVRKYVASNTMVAVRKDEAGRPIAFVEPDGNHHVAIYRTQSGEMKETIVTKWQAVNRKLHHIPTIVSDPNAMWDELANRDDVPQELMENLPEPNSEFLFSMQIGEAFILGLDDEEYKRLISCGDQSSLLEYLYFVENLSSKQYRFRRHTESEFNTKGMNKEDQRFLNIKSISSLLGYHPRKVKIDVLGRIL